MFYKTTFFITPVLTRMEQGVHGDGIMLKKMKDLVKSQTFCVLATVSRGQPHCSLMSYAVDDDCGELYMVTFRNTKKYRNLAENPAISLLIDTREEDRGEKRHETRALTVNGLFVEVKDQTKRNMIKARLLERHPHLITLTDNADAEFFTVRIKSMQLLEGIADASFEIVE